DVGCGTGRVTFPLAQAGYTVVGIDTSAEMLRIARRKLEHQSHLNIELIQVDVLTYQPERVFSLILLPFNMLMHFTEPETGVRLLRHLAELLAKDGLMVIDLPNAADMFSGDNDDAYIVLERTFIMPDSGNTVMQQSVRTLNRLAQQMTVTWIYDEIASDGRLKRTLIPLHLRYIYHAEMNLMLAAAGLYAAEYMGDYAQNELRDGCERMIVLAKKS
ncbi:MAG TPA: class I SAM-dependent methyltransferase, partial [Aggregatilineales bacterium]|nr:class I SAM-dependent methyltransferase [Aggregatilineales bacterium]